MTTLSANRFNQLQLPLADIEQLFCLRQKQQALGDLSQFAHDWLMGLREKYPRFHVLQHGEGIPSLTDIKHFAKAFNGGQELGWRKLAIHDGDWQPTDANLIDDYLRQSLSACSMRIHEQHDRLIIAPLIALDILAIQPLIKHSSTLASHLALDLLRPALPALHYIDCNALLVAHQNNFSQAFRESRQHWPQGNNLPWLRAWWDFLFAALESFCNETDNNAIGIRRGSRRALIEFYVAEKKEGFTLQTICAALPSVSRDMIRLVLAEMRQKGKLKCESRGRNALWLKSIPAAENSHA